MPTLASASFFRRTIFACALALSLLVAGCAKKDPHELVVGMELSYPPFEMLDEHGEPRGIGVDMAKALAASLHRELRIENTPFAGLITALKTGKIDLIISSMTVTPDRLLSIDFSDPYIHTGIAILASTRSDIQSIADVDQPGHTVVTKSGTTGDTYAREHFKKVAAIRSLEDEANCALEVSQGKADCFIYDQMAVFRHQRKYPDTTRALLEPFQRESWAIGIRKGDDELRRQVNAFLADFKARNAMEALGEKYLKADKEMFAKMGYPFSS